MILLRKMMFGSKSNYLFLFFFGFLIGQDCDEDEVDEHITEFIKFVKQSVRLVVDNNKEGLIDE